MGIKRNLETAGISENSNKITEDEAALYDRQIRLWGMECQKRLREARILFIGINGVTAEVVKNLTLSGVKSITLIDDKEVTEYDTTANFFLTSNRENQKRAEASVTAVRELNPNVKVEVLPGDDLLSKPDDFYGDFDVVVATECTLPDVIKLNNICREHNIKFFCTETWGFYGYFFLDLGKHTFRSVIPIPAGSKQKDNKEKIEQTSKEETLEYCPVEHALRAKLGDGVRKRVNKVFILMHIIYNFHEKFNRYPSPEFHEKDFEELKKNKESECAKLGYNESKITDEMLKSCFGQLSPVCASVGGILANEVIKAISRNGLPVHNFFLFDGHEFLGVNETVIKK